MEQKFFFTVNILQLYLLLIFTTSFVGAFSIEANKNIILKHKSKEYSINNLRFKYNLIDGFRSASNNLLGNPYNHNRSPRLCLTDECIHTASSILKNMDSSVNPCDNFYQFACGKYVENAKIPSDESSVSEFSKLQIDLQNDLKDDLQQPLSINDSKPIRLVKALYKSCMDVSQIEDKGLTYVKSVLKDVGGGWPVLEQNWNKNAFNWIETINNLSKIGFSGFSFVQTSIVIDSKNSSQRRIYISGAFLLLSRKFLVAGREDPIVKAYYKFMVDIAEMFGADKNNAEQELDEVVQFAIDLANIALTKEQKRNETALYNPITISKLEQIAPFIPWLTHLNSLLLNEAEVFEDTVVIVESFEFLKNIEDLLQRTSKRTQANYLLWITTYSSISYLTDALRKRKFEFTKLLSGQIVEVPRWTECVNKATSRMSLAVSALYVQEHFNRETRGKANEMVTDIRAEFEKRLYRVNWMDEKTKRRALDKVRGIQSYVGYPDELLDNDKLTDYYKDLEINDSDYLASILNLSLFDSRIQYRRLNEPVDKTDWKRHAFVAIINAFYNPQDNSIQIPAGILQGKFFNAKRPRYMNYGAIGFVIGHEITHGFDDEGKQFDQNGDLVNWWEPVTEKSFSERAQCIINQYGNYTVPELNNLHLNGINTQGENIADNGGVKVSYAAYQDWVKRNGPEPILPNLEYTANQLFWISTANIWCSKYRPEELKVLVLTNEHSPPDFRIIGSFSNAEQFSRDFHCPLGSPMNPETKCAIW